MKKKVLRTSYAFLFCYLLINLTSCNQSPKEGAVADLLDKSGIDSSVRPQDNFYKYVNGGWIKHTEIPPSKSYWGVFSIINENTSKLLKSLLDSCSALHAPKGSYEQLAGDLYASAMDSVTIEQKGLTPLNSDLQRIAAIQSSKDILNEVAYEYTMGVYPLMGFYAKPDDKNSSAMVAGFSQGGLGLPSKDYYFKMDSATLNIRNNYLKYITKVLHLAGDDSVSAIREAGEILTLETALAKESKSPVELRDPEANYHKLSLLELNKLTPNINWLVLMDSLHIKQDSVVVGQPGFYKQLSSLLRSVPINNWKNYLRFHVIDAYAPYLSTSFVNANFDMGIVRVLLYSFGVVNNNKILSKIRFIIYDDKLISWS
jgi:putative endopeptidase